MSYRNHREPPAAPAPAAESPDEAIERPRYIDSAGLFGSANEIVIRHGGREYRLRRTRLDKLILTA